MERGLLESTVRLFLTMLDAFDTLGKLFSTLLLNQPFCTVPSSVTVIPHGGQP